MPILQVNVSDYKRIFGKNEEEHGYFKSNLDLIVNKILVNIKENITVDMYNLNGEVHSYEAGKQQSRMVIFSNATATGTTEKILLKSPEKINNVENNFTKFLAPLGDGVIIVSEKGIPLAEWREKHWELNILFDLFETYNEESLNIFEYIISEFDRLVWLPKTLQNSWKFTQNKNALISEFTEKIQHQKRKNIKSDEEQVIQWEKSIKDYMQGIKTISDNIIQKRRNIEAEKQHINNSLTYLAKDLDLIIKNNKIKDLRIEDGNFIVFTNPLYIYTDKGDRYYGGKYVIRLNPINFNLTFSGDNPRKGFWTDHDPHPHISGNGSVCFGNVSGTIAELCSQMQIYALIMVCIDFLESANTTDVAGKMVKSWDKVDEDGNIIAEKYKYSCENCDNGCDELFLVYEEVIDERDDEEDSIENIYTSGELNVCASCRDNDFDYDDVVEEYIRN